MRSKFLFTGTSIAALAVANLAYAQSSTETYQYDALGRLIKVETTNGSNDGQTRDITYDDADNRISYEATGGPTPAPSPSPTPSPSPSPTPTPAPTPTPPPPSNDPQADLEADFANRTNSGMWDLRAASNSGAFSAANIVSGLPSLTEEEGGTLVAVDSVTGARLDGRGLRAAAAGNFMVYLLLRKDPDDEIGRIIFGNWPTRVRYWDGDGHVAGGVDIRFYAEGSFGVPVSNRDVMHDTLDDNAFHSIKAGTFAFNASQDLLIGTKFGGMEGDVIAVVALDLNEVSDLNATETLIANWFESISPN